MKLPAKLLKKAEVGEVYTIINNGDSAFKTSLFDNLTVNADTEKVDKYFPKNEGEVKVEKKFADVGGFLGLACADKGWLVINKDYAPIVKNPEISLTTFKSLYGNVWHTSLVLYKDNEPVGLIMAVITRGTKEEGEIFDKLNEVELTENLFETLNKQLEKFIKKSRD